MRSYQSVFKDETKLDINYVPYRLPHRETEKRLLMEFFKFILRFPDRMTQRVIVTGDVGTGKTALSQRFGAEITLKAKNAGHKLRYVHVNCREYRGRFSLIIHNVVSIFHPNFPKRGYTAEEILEALLKILEEENVYIILALDEFGSLIEQEGSEAVYKLTRIQEMRLNKPQRVSLICILRDLKPIGQLDSSSKSTLQQNIINLENYSKKQLADILSDRVNLACKPLTVSEDVVSLIAELAFSENGNARFAIELLWRAGKYADAEDRDEVTPECVRQAVSSIIPTIRKNELSSLKTHEKLFLLGVARIFKERQKAYTTLNESEKAYAVVCEEFNEQPHSHTQLWKYLRFMSALGILKTEVSTLGKRGRSTLVYLPTVPARELEKELSEALKN